MDSVGITNGQRIYIPQIGLVGQRPRRCANCPFRTTTCGSKGPIDSPFVIVGESPGQQEVQENKPFVGPSGKVVETAIAQVLKDFPELGNVEPYYTNAFICKPRMKDFYVLQEATQCCSGRLVEEVKRYPRKVILALGNAALWGLTNDYSTRSTSARGRHYSSPLAEHGIVAAVHPAYLLRGGGSPRLFKRDVAYALDMIDGVSKYHWTDTQCIIMETEDDIRNLINEASKQEYIAADIETSSFKYLDPTGFILSQGFCWNAKEAYIVPAHLFKFLGPIYDPSVVRARYIWHNGKFDTGWLRYEAERNWNGYDYFLQMNKHLVAKWGPRKGYEHATCHEDTMLLSYALDEQNGIHDLETVSNDYIGAPNWKGMKDKYLPKKGASYSHIPPDTLYMYQAKDVGNTLQVFPILREEVKRDPDLEKLYTKTLMPGQELLTWVERNGFEVDREQIHWNRVRYAGGKTKTGQDSPGRIAIAEERVNVWARKVLGHNINPGSYKQVQDLLYVGGLNLLKGRIGTTDADFLEQRLPDHPVIPAIVNFREERKALGTYVEGIEKRISPDGRVHCSYPLHATTTGRLASRDPNLQNIDRDPELKGEFLASVARWLLSVDVDQAELRSLACLSGDRALCQIFEDGIKIHPIVATEFYGARYTEDQYQLAKAITFGIVYGRTARSIALEYDIPTADAQRYIDAWFERFPGARDFIKRCRDAPRRNVTLKTPFGNKRRFGIVAPEALHLASNAAANFPHQSIASHCTLHAAITCMPQLKKWGNKIVNLVHDDIIQEIDQNVDLLHTTAEYVKKAITETPPKWGLKRVPFTASAKFGTRWGYLMKDKELEDLSASLCHLKMLNGQPSIAS